MQAARFYGTEDLRIEEVEEPHPGPGQVKLRNAYVGICGSDLHSYFAPETNPFLSDEPHPLTGAKLPQIFGHEVSGTIVELGEGVTDLSVGDRGAVFPLVVSCGVCAACRKGLPMTCPLMAAVGTNVDRGGLSEFMVIDADKFHRLPENVDLRLGALVEPLAVGWHGVVRSGAQPGATALLVGAGPVGIGAWYAFRAHGIDRVLVSEPNAERREAIRALGATVIDPVHEDLAAAVAELSAGPDGAPGSGVDHAVDAAGVEAGFLSAMSSLAPGGRLAVVAMYERPIIYRPVDLMLGEKEVVGAVGYRPEDFDGIIAAMADGVYDATGWVSERPFAEVVDAIRELHAGAGAKILMRIE